MDCAQYAPNIYPTEQIWDILGWRFFDLSLLQTAYSSTGKKFCWSGAEHSSTSPLMPAIPYFTGMKHVFLLRYLWLLIQYTFHLENHISLFLCTKWEFWFFTENLNKMWLFQVAGVAFHSHTLQDLWIIFQPSKLVHLKFYVMP